MNRLAGIIVAAVGFAVCILGVTKVLPGLTGTGVALLLLGGLIIGLSFIDKPDTEGTEKMSTPGTLGNIFFEPTNVFKNLRRHPRWLVAALIMAVLSGVYSNLFLYRMGADRVANFAIDKTKEMSMIPDEAKAKIEEGRPQALIDNKNPVLRSAQVVSSFVGSVFLFAFLALVFYLFALAMGGKINYWQAFSVAVYATFPVAVIRFVLNTVIIFIKDPTDIHPITGQTTVIQDNLGFLVLTKDYPVIHTLLGAFSLLSFYWIWLNVTGLKNGGEKVTGTIAWSATLALFFIGLLLGLTAAYLFPQFIS